MTVIRTPLLFLLTCLGLFWLLPWPVHYLTVPVAFIALGDVIARLKQYYKYRKIPINPRLLRRLKHSLCERSVALAIAEYQARKEVNLYYYIAGYRWWHIFPDGFPWCLLRPSWWRIFF